jgi:hypothetical protein
MRRREFLVKTSRSALGLGLVQPFLQAQSSTSATDKEQLVAVLKDEIPRTMEDTQVPALSIADL